MSDLRTRVFVGDRDVQAEGPWDVGQCLGNGFKQVGVIGVHDDSDAALRRLLEPLSFDSLVSEVGIANKLCGLQGWSTLQRQAAQDTVASFEAIDGPDLAQQGTQATGMPQYVPKKAKQVPGGLEHA